MDLVLPFVVGALVAAGLYMMMRRSSMKLIVGLALLGQAANLLIFTVGSLEHAAPPLVPEGQRLPPAASADPLPQAMILTAIVISFGLLAFTTGLVYCTFRQTGTDDVDSLTTTEE